MLDLNRIPESLESENLNNKYFLDAEIDNGKINDDILRTAKNKRYILNTNLRIYLAIWASLIVSTWMYKVGEILVNNNDLYCLSENVLITLLTTTTIQVIAIVAIAMKDLFNKKSEEKIN
tara:strand:+ start:1762 stop:2121 length:360 start_codon:yes stop_codon:yes gene_type:complete